MGCASTMHVCTLSQHILFEDAHKPNGDNGVDADDVDLEGGDGVDEFLELLIGPVSTILSFTCAIILVEVHLVIPIVNDSS